MCPWRAFYDDFVRRTLDAYGFFESGNLMCLIPEPSHRLIDGISFYHRTKSSIYAQQLKLEREERSRRG